MVVIELADPAWLGETQTPTFLLMHPAPARL